MRVGRIVPATAAAIMLAGCTTGGQSASRPGAELDLSGQTIEVLAVWSDDEQASFEQIAGNGVDGPAHQFGSVVERFNPYT